MNVQTETTDSKPTPPPTAIVAKTGAGYDLARLVGSTVATNGVARDLPGFHSAPLPDVSQLPGLVYGLDLLVDQLIQLRPEDIEIELHHLYVNPETGRFFRSTVGGVWLDDAMKKPGSASFTHTACSQLLSFFDTNLPRYVTANFCFYNSKPRHYMFEDLKTRAQNRMITARFVRTADGIRVLRAVCSDTHTLKNGDTLAVAKLLRAKYGDGSKLAHECEDAKINANWSWDTSTIVIYFGAVDEKSRAVVSLRLSETKQHSWGATNGLYVAGRTYWGWQPAGDAAHGRHVGEQVASKMLDSVETARIACDQVREALDVANRTFLNVMPDDNELNNVRRAFEVNASLHEATGAQLAIQEDEEMITVARYIDALIDVAALETTNEEARKDSQRVVGAILKKLFEGEFAAAIR